MSRLEQAATQLARACQNSAEALPWGQTRRQQRLCWTTSLFATHFSVPLYRHGNIKFTLERQHLPAAPTAAVWVWSAGGRGLSDKPEVSTQQSDIPS